METYVNNADYLTIQEEAFLELHKILNTEDALKASKVMAIYGLEMQNRGFERNIKRRNEVSEKFSAEKTRSNSQWTEQLLSFNEISVRTLKSLISDNNEMIIKILKMP